MNSSPRPLANGAGVGSGVGVGSPGPVARRAAKSTEPPSPASASTSTSTPAHATAPATAPESSGPGPGPSPHLPRRTTISVDEGVFARRRPTSGNFGFDPQLGDLRRRGSTFSDLSLTEARRNLHDDILNPGGMGSDDRVMSWSSSLPLVFALLPAVGGVFFKNGSAVITDIMLLGLAAVFLNWSVTQPWAWYKSAQEVRVREETVVEMALEDDSENEKAGDLSPPPSPTKLNGVLEDQGASPDTATRRESGRDGNADASRGAALARKALNELYIHEVAALLLCFASPVVGAWILHAIRNQLSRPSEGLVSNYNLTIFILAAEIVPLSHTIKLVQGRTLHLQRVVQSNPYRQEMVTPAQVQDLVKRLDELEATQARLETAAVAGAPEMPRPLVNGTGGDVQPQPHQSKPSDNKQQEARIARDVRNSIGPELEALNRAVRRYEKKASVLSSTTEARLIAVNARVNDAIALTAAVSQRTNNRLQHNFRLWPSLRALGSFFFELALVPFVLVLAAALKLAELVSATFNIEAGKKRPGVPSAKRGQTTSQNAASAASSRRRIVGVPPGKQPRMQPPSPPQLQQQQQPSLGPLSSARIGAFDRTHQLRLYKR
ncbi:hypothetical protein B0T24DRAFT_189367 [Lasiosphaeria ovina]|uniref:Uncharacterized protein n=1 Tax=Lasiosphaeria ovina TaxID=92902 RepID=A0AAE0NF19_9PEZI|nr:hypothetical protein B0T24DRAFT_189367 [Lasiosphaeria ovina]